MTEVTESTELATIASTLCIVENYNEVIELIDKFSQETLTSYCVRNTTRHFNVDRTKIEEVLSQCNRKSLHWDGHTDSKFRIPFSGSPYFQLGSKMWACHQSKDYEEARKECKRAERLLNATDRFTPRTRKKFIRTKKLGCPAEIKAIHVVKFPHITISKDATYYKRAVENGRLRQLLRDRTPTYTEEQFFVFLPALSEHKFHSVMDERAGARERVDHRVRAKIIEMIEGGASTVKEINRGLEEFVANAIAHETENTERWRNRFFPSENTIRHHLRVHRMSQLPSSEETNLTAVVEATILEEHPGPEAPDDDLTDPHITDNEPHQQQIDSSVSLKNDISRQSEILTDKCQDLDDEFAAAVHKKLQSLNRYIDGLQKRPKLFHLPATSRTQPGPYNEKQKTQTGFLSANKTGLKRVKPEDDEEDFVVDQSKRIQDVYGGEPITIIQVEDHDYEINFEQNN